MNTFIDLLYSKKSIENIFEQANTSMELVYAISNS